MNESFPEPTNYEIRFESDVYNSFEMLGLNYKCFCYPTKENDIRLLSPKSILDHWNTEKHVFDCLVSKNLVEEFEPDNFIHHGNKVKIQYRLTKTGQKLFDELLPYEIFQRQEIFVNRVKPQLQS